MTFRVVMLGHKDHGKSTFLGRLLYETRSVPDDKVQTVKEIDAEAGRPFEWAHLLDSFKEEREQEMTYDTASVFVKGKSAIYSFIDVPGHEELVHQMLSGASQADAAVLVISAKEGVDVMSVKHFALAKLLGISRLMVAINKMDAMGYDKKAFDTVRGNIAAEISRAGFDDKDVLYFPISAAEGDNIVTTGTHMPWYAGTGIFEHIEGLPGQVSEARLPLRMLVQDVYVGEKDYVVTNVKSGTVRAHTDLLLMPDKLPLRADELFSVSQEPIGEASAPQNVNIALVSQPLKDKLRGSILCLQDELPVLTKTVEAKVFFFKDVPAAEDVTVECGRLSSTYVTGRNMPFGEIFSLSLQLTNPILFDTKPTFLNKFVFKKRGDVVGVGVVAKA